MIQEGDSVAEAGTKAADGSTDPVLARFLLDSAIRQLRAGDDRGPHALAEAAGISHATLKRWLRGSIAEWRRPQLQALLLAFGYMHDHPTTQQLVQLAADARNHNVIGSPEWLRSTAFDLLLAIEEVSEEIRTYELTVVPGLVQTEDYARAHFAQAGVQDEADLEEKVRVRMSRQRILHRTDLGTDAAPVHYTAVIDEAVLHRSPADHGVMRGQLEHLLNLGALPNVTLQVIPYSAGPYTAEGNGPFVILNSARVGRQITYVETSMAATYLETPEAERRYQSAWARLAGRTLGPEKSADLIRALLSTT